MVACTDTIRRRVGAPRTWFGRRRDHQHWAGTGRLRPCLGVGPDRPTPRTWRNVVDVFMQAGAGLAAAQAAGVVHRNVKPDNILVGEERPRLQPRAPVRVAHGQSAKAMHFQRFSGASNPHCVPSPQSDVLRHSSSGV